MALNRAYLGTSAVTGRAFYALTSVVPNTDGPQPSSDGYHAYACLRSYWTPRKPEPHACPSGAGNIPSLPSPLLSMMSISLFVEAQLSLLRAATSSCPVSGTSITEAFNHGSPSHSHAPLLYATASTDGLIAHKALRLLMQITAPRPKLQSMHKGNSPGGKPAKRGSRRNAYYWRL